MPNKSNKKKNSSKTNKPRAAQDSRDAISMLKADHKKVRGLLEQLGETSERGLKKREELVATIENEIKVHTQIEEEIFYPAFKEAVQKKDDEELYYEAIEEHHVVDFVLPELVETDPGADNFSAKVKVLKDLIEHHAIKEEEAIMFPRARKVLSKGELEELGERMSQRKTELASEPMRQGS
jgi:hemerythrin-like domain-containing protein